ncbi:MAG TPA: lysylphosphatidylglycerol synthase transmembrane domain-containing protein, partial [Ktedonobacteraceae bacterium]|nr:lysylphosphatidylglycerol synthase transmembrane domain-containing protein [Ktedonobacteraceae bacterium]
MIIRNPDRAPVEETLTQASQAPEVSEEHTSIESSESIEQKVAALSQQQAIDEPEISQKQLSISSRLLNWRTIVPLVIVIVALVYFAKQANIDPQKTLDAIKHANFLFVLAAFFTYYLSFPIRTLRWRILLQNVGYRKEYGVTLPKFPKLLEIIYISWFANVIVPAKLGDLYRAYLLRKETNLSATRTFGTVLAERLLDLIVLLLLFIPGAFISLHENLPPQLQTGLKVTLVAIILGIVGLFVLRLFPSQI